jgi:WD40 repeat protein
LKLKLIPLPKFILPNHPSRPKFDRSLVDPGNDNPMLVSGSRDGTLKIWDLKTYQEIRTLSGHKDDTSSVAVSADAKHIISGGADTIVKLWCFHTGKLLSCFKGHNDYIE